MSNTETTIIEFAPFKVRPGVTEEQVRQASAELQVGFLARQPGFLRRELLRGPHGYVDLVWWSDQTAADRAMAAVAGSDACARYFALMVQEDGDPGAGVLHLSRLAAFERR